VIDRPHRRSRCEHLAGGADLRDDRAKCGMSGRLPLRIAAERATLNGMKFSVFWAGAKHDVGALLHRKPDCEGHVFVWTQEAAAGGTAADSTDE